MLTLLTFILPPGEGEKIGLGTDTSVMLQLCDAAAADNDDVSK